MRFSMESREPQFRPPEKPSSAEIAKAERDLNEIIPILAHGLVRRIEQKGFSGKVRVTAMAGDSWGVGKSPDNPTDVPNVIIYPREALSGDKRLMNARLRHEIGNLNYPIDSELNGLRDWCQTNHVAPELLTSLVEATHEASVNFLEMQNSHSANPEDNFRALYEEDINTQQMADGIAESVPYKQAVDLTMLYSLAQTGLIPAARFEQALSSAHPTVQGIFDKQTRSVLDQTVRMAVPKKQVQLVREYLWPKFSQLVALSSPAQEKVESSATVSKQAREVRDRIKKLMDQMGKKPEPKSKNKPKAEQAQKPERKMPKRQEMSQAEQREVQEEKNLLAESLQEQLQQAKEQLEKLQKPGQQPEAAKPQEKPQSMQEIGKQAEQMKAEAEKAMKEAKESGAEEITEEQLQKLKEQLEQLEEVAKQIAESGELEKELEKPEEEPINYNIKEYGIDESALTPEQLEHLNKVRGFAQNTSRVYRTAMRLVMRGYQQRNPNFSDKTLEKIMERGFDIPEFSIYGSQAAQGFLQEQSELGIEEFSDNLLVNFQLPRPLAKFWYKGGDGKLSQPVKEGEIEWGHFYRMCMPVIYSGVDRAQMSGLYLSRVNQFGQHDPKKYYYLWEAINMAMEDQANQDEESKSDESDESEGSEQGEQGEGQEQGEESQGQESGESGSESGRGEGQGEGGEAGSEGGQQGGGQGGQPGEGGGEPGGSAESGGGMPSAQEMQEMISQMQDMLNQAKEQGGQGASQQAIEQMLQQLSEMQQGLESGASPQDMAGQMQDAMQQLSEMMEGGQEGQGGGQQGKPGGQPGSESGSQVGGQGEDQSHDQFQQGGQSNQREIESMFSAPNQELLKQLRDAESAIGSKFSTQDQSGNFTPKDLSSSVAETFKQQEAQTNPAHARQLETLEELKRQQQAKMEAMYREMSGLDGEALRVYVDYMESTKDFTSDLTNFFIKKFKLDKEYIYERNQRRGARLQRGFTQNILGSKEGRPVISPRSFERKRQPEKPQFAWTLVIDNSGSCGGEIIEQEKKLAVALIEVAKSLDIPLEIVTFGGSDQFRFLKTFEQELAGEDLQKTVLLNADQGTPDVVTLDAACTSMEKFSDRFKRSYNFVYFMTDGQSGEGSIQEVIKKHKKNMVITGIGMAGAAQTIAQTWGKNAVEVPDVKKLSDAFIRKVEDQIDSTFD